MAGISEQQVVDALKRIVDPASGKDIHSAGMVSGLIVRDGNVGFAIEVDPRDGAKMEPLRKAAEQAVFQLDGVTSVTAVLTAQSAGQSAGAPAQQAPPPQQGAAQGPGQGPGIQQVPGIGAIVAVASGKGGVGKSTVATNLAVALAALGHKVGMLDADIYGPSQPRMMGIGGRPESPDGKTLLPLEAYGVAVMSIGFLVAEDTPMIWRGPMVQSALQQMLRDVRWGTLDILIVDMPPGTGDTQLTLAQKVPVSGAIIVTTPQDIALLDAKKGFKMFEKVEVPVLGIVENMSIHICSKCGHEEHIFGEGGGQRMSEEYDVDFLGALPLDLRIREETDSGKPTVVAEPDSRISQIYREIARRAAAKLSLQAKNYAAKFPKIVIQNN
jgi:ATP-binding protein involved in chromosome partitioning